MMGVLCLELEPVDFPTEQPTHRSNLSEQLSPSKEMTSQLINAPTQTPQRFALYPRLQPHGWHWTWEEELMLTGWRSSAEQIAVEKVSETLQSGSLIRCLHQVLLWRCSD